MMENDKEENLMTFGGHLEVFRKMLLRVIAITVCLSMGIFCAKGITFSLLLAPSNSNFLTYRLIEYAANKMGGNFHFTQYSIQLISTDLSSQFMIHVSTSIYLALLLASPYVVVELYRFIAPALYDSERNCSVTITVAIYLLFLFGVVMSYFVLFPFALRFLGTYQVSECVLNQINLSSYISTFISLTLLMGLVFQLPVLAFFLAKMRVLESSFMKQYRRHAFVFMTAISAIITPPDIFTCCMVMLPMYGLYEISIFVVEKVKTKQLRD